MSKLSKQDRKRNKQIKKLIKRENHLRNKIERTNIKLDKFTEKSQNVSDKLFMLQTAAHNVESVKTEA